MSGSGPAGERIPVLYIAPWVDLGGADTGTIDWFRWIDRDRYAPSLITTQPSSNRRLAEVVPYAEEVWALPELMPGGCFPGFILDFIASRGVRVVHIMNSRLGFNLLPDIHRLADRPATVVQLHVDEPDRSLYVRYVCSRYGNLVDAFSLSSHDLATVIARYEVPEARCHVIHTGVDADERFSPDNVEPMFEGDSARMEILYPARLEEQKDPLLMVRVAATLRDAGTSFAVHCVGDGSMEPQVREAIAAAGLEAEVLLHGPSQEMPRWYRSADVMLLTSRFEGVPYTVYEAMAMAVPVVAPSLPGNRELMGEAGGVLVDPRDDVAAYARALKRLARDPIRRERIGLDARLRVRREFSLRQMGDAHTELYAQLLETGLFTAPPHPLTLRQGREPIQLAPRPSRDEPLVSVIVPCYDHGRYLGECLQSIRAQTYPHIEVLVVDDGSTDPQTVEVLDGLAGEDGVEVLRLPHNRGPSAARNLGLTRATGRYILPVDADNLLFPDAVQRLVEQLQGAPETVGFIYPNQSFFGNRAEYHEASEYNVHSLLHGNFCDTCSLIDRGVFDAGIRYAEEVRFGHEDWDFFLQLAERGVEGQPARSPTLRTRKTGFTRSDLIDRAADDQVARMSLRHSALYADEAALKARWSPAISLVVLDPVPQDGELSDALLAGVRRQRLHDAEVILRQEGPADLDGEGPMVRRIHPRLARNRAEAAREGLAVARGRYVCVVAGDGATLLADHALLERLVRVMAADNGSAVALTDAGDGGVFPWRRLDEAVAAPMRAGAVAWSRLIAEPLPPVELDRDVASRLVDALQPAMPLVWFHHPLGEASVAADEEPPPRGVVVPPSGRSNRESEQHERAARINREPLLPGVPPSQRPHDWEHEHWRPALTQPLYRHCDPLTGHRLVSLYRKPLPGLVFEYEIGSIHRFPLQGTVPLVVTSDQVLRTVTVGEPREDEMVLGYLEANPLPLLDLVELAELEEGVGNTLLAGEDDPLRGVARPMHKLGWIEPAPLRPRSRPASDALVALAAAAQGRDAKRDLEGRLHSTWVHARVMEQQAAAAEDRLRLLTDSLPARLYRRVRRSLR